MPKVAAKVSFPCSLRTIPATSEKEKPRTPARKRWLRILKPAVLLGKRRSTKSSPTASARPVTSPRTDDHTTSPPTTGHIHALPRISVALQTEDPVTDSVIITSLPSVPFCCHADLLAMQRPALLEAAKSLNERLPSILAISLSGSDEEIRKGIEVLVGLRNDPVPGAPKAVRGYKSEKFPYGEKSPPTSPLATRSRSQDILLAMGSPPLAGLKEEDEDEIDLAKVRESTPPKPSNRSSKRRRISESQWVPPSPTKDGMPRMRICSDGTIRLHSSKFAEFGGSVPRSVSQGKAVRPRRNAYIPPETYMRAYDLGTVPGWITTRRPQKRGKQVRGFTDGNGSQMGRKPAILSADEVTVGMDEMNVTENESSMEI